MFDEFNLLRSFFASNHPSDVQIDSFDRFVDRYIKEVIREKNEIQLSSGGMQHTIILGDNVTVRRPFVKEKDGRIRDITPHECRKRGITYSTFCFIDLKHIREDEGGSCKTTEFKNVPLFEFPVMVGSKLCHLSNKFLGEGGECLNDRGGYFIVNGQEKVIISQEKLRTSFPFVFKPGATSKFDLSCEIRSMHKVMRATSTIEIVITKKKRGTIRAYVKLPFLLEGGLIPMCLVWKVLGVKRDEIGQYVQGDGVIQDLLDTIIASEPVDEVEGDKYTCQDVKDKIAQKFVKEVGLAKKRMYIDHILNSEFLPHEGTSSCSFTTRKKAVALGLMLRKLLEVKVGRREIDDRDCYAFKRLDTSGILMTLLLRQCYRQYINALTSKIDNTKGKDSWCIASEIKSLGTQTIDTVSTITRSFRFCFNVGTWGVSKTGNAQVGVVQSLQRAGLVATLSNLRRTNTPIGPKNKDDKPRQLCASAFGLVCPCETPEGAQCGIVNNLTLTCHVRLGAPEGVDEPCSRENLEYITGDSVLYVREPNEDTGDSGVCPSTALGCERTLLTVNGIVFGSTVCPLDVVRLLREARRSLVLPFDTSVAYRKGSPINVTTDPGCLCRPLIRTDKMRELASILSSPSETQRSGAWNILISKGIVEYIDKEEESTLMVALTTSDLAKSDSYTHIEMHPTIMYSVSACLIPFINYNPYPRGAYQSAMGKQSIGTYATNYESRVDTKSHVLVYPQRPLVRTWYEDLLSTVHSPSGTNMLVAICPHSGYNQEDSVVLNRRSCDSDFATSVTFKTHRDSVEDNVNGSENQRFCNPVCEGKECKLANYDKLEKDGLPKVGRIMNPGDVLIGKLAKDDSDFSTVLKNNDHERGVVHAVDKFKNRGGSNLVNVKLRKTRQPCHGDKFSSRHGQKGVTGLITDDIPFDPRCGVQPDIMINPCALPSRMTIGHIMDTLLGKLKSTGANFGSGTPFTEDTSMETIGDELEKRGFERFGNQRMFNSRTGQPMRTQIFVGTCFYQRLHHLAENKLHMRNRGPKACLTQQPLEGRSREGGLRIGEMERDCILAHGAGGVLRDGLYNRSDPFICHVCTKCGNLADPPSSVAFRGKRKESYCRVCNLKGEEWVKPVEMPYSTKLFIQEVSTLGVKVKLGLEKNV